MRASQFGFIDTLKVLLAAGADVDAVGGLVFKIFCSCIVKSEASLRYQFSRFWLLTRSLVSYLCFMQYGDTALTLAASHHQVVSVKLLIEAGVNLDVQKKVRHSRYADTL